jgi:hypothetical protein
MKALSITVASLVLWAGIAPAQTITVNTTVNGTTGPWLFANGGLNTAYQYDNVIQFNSYYDYVYITPPTVISAADGFRFSVGDSLTISYLSGGIATASGAAYYNALGNTSGGPLNNSNPSNYGPAPSFYMNPSSYPIYTGELVGTFANSTGQIVGTPFAVGNLGTATIPVGATRLQLGVNDDLFGDNSGSWNIQVTGIPEPATWSLLALGIVAILGGCRVRRCSP